MTIPFEYGSTKLEGRAENLLATISGRRRRNGAEQRAEFESLRSTTATEPLDKGEYLQIVGKLVWPMSMTRVDCAMEMSTLCSCVGDTRTIHRDWAFVVMGYMTPQPSGAF